MPTYKAPVDDALFLLNDVFHIDRYGNLPGFSDASPDVERERRHVVAELDLFGTRGTDQVGHSAMCLVDDRIGRLARREGATGVGVRVGEVSRDGVDDSLRDLGAARSVEEGNGSATLLAAKCRELGAQRFDVEHGSSIMPGADAPPENRNSFVLEWRA